MLNIAVVLDKIPYSSLPLICLSEHACIIVKVHVLFTCCDLCPCEKVGQVCCVGVVCPAPCMLYLFPVVITEFIQSPCCVLHIYENNVGSIS